MEKLPEETVFDLAKISSIDSVVEALNNHINICDSADETLKKNIVDMDEIDGSTVRQLLSLMKLKEKMDPCPVLSISKNSAEYNMNHRNRGKCLIINNRMFEPTLRLSERKGTEVDAKALYDCFRNLGFDVIIHEDRTAKEINQVIKDMAMQDYTHDDCFVCCVLTHGELGTLWARDEKYIIDLLFQPFKGDNCKSLAGKPKIFFVQACQGDKLDAGIKVAFHDVPDACSSQNFYRIPSWSDFLIVYSTVPGYYSWRNTTNGSWFVQALTTTLNKYYRTDDILSMMTTASRMVAYEFESYVPTDSEFDKKKQIPCVTSMLTRRVYFPPKMRERKETVDKKESEQNNSKNNNGGSKSVSNSGKEQKVIIHNINHHQMKSK